MAAYSVNNSNGRFTLRLTLTQGESSASDNTSPVSYKLELIANTAWNFEKFAIGSKVILDGTTVHEQARTVSKQYSIADYGTLPLAEGIATVKHDDNGSKIMPYSFSIDMATAEHAPGPLSSSGTMTLTSIARKATTTLVSNFTDEQNPTFHFSNPGGFDVMPYFNVYVSGTTDNAVCGFSKPIGQYSSPCTIVLTDTERETLRTATKDSRTYDVYIGVQTLDGSTSLGWDSKKAVLSIVNANPIFTDDQVSYVDVNAATYALTESEGQSIVSSMSSVNATWEAATGSKGATISRYDISLGSAYKSIDSAEGGTVELGSVTSNTDLTLSILAVDSRGNSTLVQKTVPVFPYSEPKIAYHSNYDYIECARCDENGAIDKSGKNLKVMIQGKWSAFPNNKNVGKLQVMYTTKGVDSNWYDLSPTDDTVGDSSNLYVTQGNFNGVAEGVTLDVTKSYTVTLRCIDSLGKFAKVSYKIPTQVVDFHLRKGAAFGEYVTEEKTLKLSNEWTTNGLFGMGKCIQLSAGANTNDCLDFRVYGISQAVCSSVLNMPETIAGTIRVFSGDGLAVNESGYINIIQEFMTATGTKVYRRRVYKSVSAEEWNYGSWRLCQQDIS